MTLTLLGEPRSTSHIYQYACRGNHPCMYMTKIGRFIKEDYAWQARSQYHGNPLSGRLRIEITIYFGTKRKADWDNFHKLSMDALTGIVWADDSQIEEATVVKRYDKQNPRIEIVINESP